jgi:hypothetical protein
MPGLLILVPHPCKSLIENDFRNKPLALKGDKLIRALQTDKSTDATITTAKRLLVFVDKIEQVK